MIREKLVETSAFPEEWKEHARMQAQSLERYRSSDINWTYISNDHLVVNKEGKSEISYGDAAVAIINEIREHRFVKKRFTAGYDN